MRSTAKHVWGHQEHVRTDMFYAAQLRWGNEHAPVTIRSMSSSDALLDSALVPTPNAWIHLTRGCHGAEGRVIWTKEGRLGVRFRSRVSFADWFAPPGAHSELPSADSQILPLRAGSAVFLKFNCMAEQEVWNQALYEDLALVKRLVEQTGDSLATDPRVMQRHIVELQSFDLTMQMLSLVCAELNGNEHGSSGLVGREEIRRSCSAALDCRPR